MLTNAIKLAWKVLLRHPFYTFVTLFGISLTLTVLMVMTSFMDHLIGNHYPEHKRERMLYIQKVFEQDSLKQSSRSMAASFNFMKKYVISLKTPEKVGITTFIGFANTYVNGHRISLQTKMTNAGFWDVADFEFLEGKPYNDLTIDRGESVAVITDDLKRQYFEDETQPVVGKPISIDNATYRIIGVVRAAPVTRPFTSADVYFPYTIAKSNYKAQRGMTGSYVAMLLARDPADLPAIKQEFEAGVARIPLPGIDDGWKYYHLKSTAETYLDNWLSGVFIRTDANGSRVFYSVVFLFALLFMSLPAINLVNLNVSRIMERASEIGIRKAFGAPVRTLVGQFLIENLFITFLGGLIAVALSALVIYLINSSGWIAKSDLTLNLWVFLISLIICFFFGFLSGVVPALRMAKLSIADALKNT
jgi:putative ABC transport system permease protein